MKAVFPSGIVILLAIAVSGCKQEAEAPTRELVVRTAMQQQVNPITTAMWDIGNNALNDDGEFDAAKLDDAKWTALAAEAEKLAATARTMAAASSLKAADPKNSAVGAGEVPMDKVQGRLDADPNGFRQEAALIATYADKIAAAAKIKDGKAAGDLVGGLDGVCEGCHKKFWDPG